MAFKHFKLDDLTEITVYKLKSSRSLRLSISANGKIRVTIPTWVPYQQGITFAQSRKSWIEAQRKPEEVIREGALIGKAHHVTFTPVDSLTNPVSRIRNSEIVITYPSAMDITNPSIQHIVKLAGIRALRAQAKLLLPQRLLTLAAQKHFNYHSVTIKQLRGRWGSCDQHQNIVLNLYLMQLPWEYIDYVLLHELTHTKVLHHGPEFWRVMEDVFPNSKKYRKDMKQFHPTLSVST